MKNVRELSFVFFVIISSGTFSQESGSFSTEQYSGLFHIFKIIQILILRVDSTDRF